jgi:hypothetical protein
MKLFSKKIDCEVKTLHRANTSQGRIKINGFTGFRVIF